jgi:hypothetical protein
MPTLYEAIKEAVEQAGGRASREDIKRYVDRTYPDNWRPKALTTYLYGCAINNSNAIHYPGLPKILFRRADDSFELYDSAKHGENIWIPSEEEDQEAAEGEYDEASISMERDLEEHLVKNIGGLEPGLTFQERQMKTDVGRIDILAKDKQGTLVVVEIKVGEAKDSAVGQVTRYMGWISKNKAKATVRGMLVASEFSEGTMYSARIVPNLSLVKFKVRFEFERQSL